MAGSFRFLIKKENTLLRRQVDHLQLHILTERRHGEHHKRPDA